MKNNKRAQRHYADIVKKYGQLKHEPTGGKLGALYHRESLLRSLLKQLETLWEAGFSDYKDIHLGLVDLFNDVSSQLLERYNHKNGTDYTLGTVTKGHRKEYFQSGLMSVLTAHHIPKMVQEAFKSLLPMHPQEEYPAARKLTRKFYLHLGETNTGKTYNALQRLMKCERGAYLAPLRILALENYERLNNEGIPCNLLTGEEEIETQNAKHLCCTVEKASLDSRYDVAVIDEVQLVADSRRGDAWTRAILGLCCEEIHLCGASLVLDQLIHMITDCGDTYELQIYTRSIPLKVEHAPVKLSSIHAGDALVSFSKRGVLGLSNRLSEMGIQNNVIYGDLPPEVRRMQYDAFIHSEKPVLVATDAIGMGVNLPIRRLIFTQTEKFDGENVRPLTSQEVKQIAGRAGRIGIYDVGYIACLDSDIDYIEEMLEAEDEPISKAVVGPSEAILKIGLLPLRDKLALWNMQPEALPYYRKKDVRDYLVVLDLLKPYRLPEKVQWQLMRIPFDLDSDLLLEQFDYYVQLYFKEHAEKLPCPLTPCHTLSDWELYYQQVNLYYAFSKAMNMPVNLSWLHQRRLTICDYIRRLLR